MKKLCLAWAFVTAGALPASAQIDPLLFLKQPGAKPNVIVVVETTNRMQRDADNAYYDQFIYTRSGAGYETPLGVGDANTQSHYRRKYVNLAHLDTSLSTDRFETDSISIVGDRDAAYSTFEARTRLGVARFGVARAIQLNSAAVRFGLIRTRQQNARVGTEGNEGPVRNNSSAQQSPTDGSGTGKWVMTRPVIDGPNSHVTTNQSPLVSPDATGANGSIATILAKSSEQEGALIGAGADTKNQVDAPIKYMLDDALAEATRLIAADTAACRNTAVVLLVGGEEGSLSGQDPASAASSFLSVSGHRVPIYVIAIAPAARAVSQLQAIAANSGGQYVEITKAMIDAVPSGSPVPQVVRAVNAAVQHAFASSTDFNTAPTASLPYGPATEYQVTSPIIGTVNLANARDINGNSLSNSVITLSNGNLIPQRSNVLLTTGFATPGPADTPGLPGRLRAFRTYRPVIDATRTSGYRFVGDGTALWVARTPTSGEGARNIYTALPDGTVIDFTTGNAGTLAPYLNDSNPSELISYVRGLPLGGFIDSTPAFLDPPSLDPPPDSDYPAFVVNNKYRRTLIFIGGNDGMMHAIDARTGVEVWAFVPFNLLPKLRALREGMAIGQTQYFVDGSAKIADVKTGDGWHTYLFFGEGPGGTFYQAFDITLPSIASSVAQDSDSVTAVLNYFNSSSRVPLRWTFPSYAHFDSSIRTTVTPYGDLGDSATAIEKSVGQTWSDPAVGAVQDATGNFAVMVGSGFLPYSQQVQRGASSAGTTFYLIDAVTGTLLDSRDVGNDTLAETSDNCAVENDCTTLKNALQSDPVATGAPNSRFVTTVYAGDLDGRLWRFSLSLSGGQASIDGAPARLFNAGSAHPLLSSMAVVNVGGTQQYVFFGSGSDLLPSLAPTEAYKLFGVLDQNGTGSQTFARVLSSTSERISAYPAVAGDIVFFTTTTFSTSPCTASDANLYAMTFIGGAAYDSTGDNTVDRKDTPKVKTLVGAGRATAPFVADQHLVFATGSKVELFGDPQDFNNGVGQVGVRILSWREIR